MKNPYSIVVHNYSRNSHSIIEFLNPKDIKQGTMGQKAKRERLLFRIKERSTRAPSWMSVKLSLTWLMEIIICKLPNREGNLVNASSLLQRG